MKILFICKGNVGRSQIAEAMCRKIHPDWEIISAGTQLSGPEQPIGELMPGIIEVLAVMKEEGIDASEAIRNQLTEKMVNEVDKVVVIIENDVVLPDFLSSSPKLIRWNIPDVKGKDLKFTRAVKEQIKNLIAGL